MHLIKGIILLMSLSICLARNDASENYFTSTQKAANLDTNLRRALLKALTELENEENVKLKKERNNMIFEKAPASSLTFTANSIPTERNTASTSEKPIIVVQRSRGVQSRPITTFETTRLDPVKDAENILASASSSFTSSEKPQHKPQNQVSNFKTSPNANSLVNYVRITSAPNTHAVIRTTPATTTTAPPTTSTEENEAKVEDVQFFTAPLVAAFTVHQDERGLPKSVIPLYRPADIVAKKQADSFKQELFHQREMFKQREVLRQQGALRQEEQLRQQELTKRQELLKQKELLKQQEILKKQELLKREQEFQRQQNLIQRNEEQFKQRQLQHEQLRYHLALQEKQRRLEEEIRLLRQQQEQQDFYLNQQQISHENQLRAEKQFHNNQQNLVPVGTPIAIPLIKAPAVTNQFDSPPKSKGTIISLQPSITFDPNGLPANAQILPIKNAVDFRQPFLPTTTLIPLIPVSQQLRQQLSPHLPEPIPQISQPLTQQLTHDIPQYLTHQQPPSIHSVPHFSFLQTIQQQNSLPTPQSNRIFRQETGTGNFLNHISASNPTRNSFNNFINPSFQSSRFFRSNLEGTQTSPGNFQRGQSPIINRHLNNLIYNSGVYHGRQYEDLNIVSKVLSLNHLGGDQRFESSNVDEQRLPAPH